MRFLNLVLNLLTTELPVQRIRRIGRQDGDEQPNFIYPASGSLGIVPCGAFIHRSFGVGGLFIVPFFMAAMQQ